MLHFSGLVVLTSCLSLIACEEDSSVFSQDMQIDLNVGIVDYKVKPGGADQGIDRIDEMTEDMHVAGTVMTDAGIAGSVTEDMIVAGAEMAGAEMAAEMAGAEMAGAEMAGAEMAGAEMAGAEMAGAEMAGAEMAGDLTPVCMPSTGSVMIDNDCDSQVDERLEMRCSHPNAAAC